MDRSLEGKVALVAGATRGAGRGIALELALAGATVYATGRSSDRTATDRGGTHAPFDLAHRPETIEQTGSLIRDAGGQAIALRVDHSSSKQVEALVEQIARDHGRLDILINDIWGGDALCEWGKPLWELDLPRGFEMLERAIHTHLITSRVALPLMLKNAPGLVVEVTDGAGHYYRGNAFYDLAKSSVSRIAFAMAEELRDHGISVVAISPGFLRSEAMLDHFGVREENWRDAVSTDPHFAMSETPRFVGRAIAALAADPELHERSGRGYGSWQLGVEYDLSDVDGSRPDWGAYAAQQGFGRDQAGSDQRFRAMFAQMD